MTIHLSSLHERFVRSLIESGRYESEAAVIEEALILLRECDQAKLAELRREIAIGVEQADRGELAPFDPQATLARIRAERPTNQAKS